MPRTLTIRLPLLTDNGGVVPGSSREITINAECATCRHRSSACLACTAFPDGIPRAIWSGETHHDEEYPGDRGITYEPLPGADIYDDD